MVTDWASLSYAAVLVIDSYLNYDASTAPNPTPDKDKQIPSDFLMKYMQVPWYSRFILPPLGVLQALLVIVQPLRPSMICPDPENTNPMLLQWNLYTFTFAMLMLVGGMLRSTAYRQLDKDFTFEVAKPSGLMTKGLYNWIQHPSYVGASMNMPSALFLFGRIDGAVGCFIKPGYLNLARMGLGALWASWMLLGLVGVPIRIREEEAMMKREFGKDYEEYHRKTARFVPFIF